MIGPGCGPLEFLEAPQDDSKVQISLAAPDLGLEDPGNMLGESLLMEASLATLGARPKLPGLSRRGKATTWSPVGSRACWSQKRVHLETRGGSLVEGPRLLCRKAVGETEVT